MIVQSHMGIETQTLGKYLCTGPLQKIQFFSSTPEDEVTARGKQTHHRSCYGSTGINNAGIRTLSIDSVCKPTVNPL